MSGQAEPDVSGQSGKIHIMLHPTDDLRAIADRLREAIPHESVMPIPLLALLHHVLPDDIDEVTHVAAATERPDNDKVSWRIVMLTKDILVEAAGTVEDDSAASDDAVLRAWPLGDLARLIVRDMQLRSDFGERESRSRWEFHFREDQELGLSTIGVRSPRQRDAIEETACAIAEHLR